jgi:hypothetical protein
MELRPGRFGASDAVVAAAGTRFSPSAVATIAAF